MSCVVRLKDVHKHYGDVHAVDGVTLDIMNGEFFAILGPSGSGKTTMLRLIAGFETPDSGAIELDGIDVGSAPPFNRNVNTVFQDYALFPHMTVLDNVEYGMKVTGVAKNERHERALQALSQVQLQAMASRKPSQLSGGQRQRVALARALVNQPKVLLLDEPLGALDLKLRHEMQAELKSIQKEVGITFVLVTHDQEEALSLADRMAVFKDGRIAQIGSPREVYEQPNSVFVADFVGTANVLDVHSSANLLGRQGTFAIRPETIGLGATGERTVTGVVSEVTYLGSATRVGVRLATSEVVHLLRENAHFELHLPHVGQEISISWDSKYEFQVG